MNRFIYNEGLYKPRTVLPAFFFKGSLRDASRKHKILTSFNAITFIPKYYGALNIFITPDLYSNANKSFVRSLSYVCYIIVQDNLFQTFRQILGNNEIKINRLYDFECSMTTTVTIQEEDFLLLDFKFKVEFSDRTVSDEVKKYFDSTENILVKPDKEAASNNLKRDLFDQGEKIKKPSKEMQLKSRTLAYENFFLYDNKNMITGTFVTELNQKLSTFGLVSFSGEAKNNRKLDLITPDRKLKFNMKKMFIKIE